MDYEAKYSLPLKIVDTKVCGGVSFTIGNCLIDASSPIDHGVQVRGPYANHLDYKPKVGEKNMFSFQILANRDFYTEIRFFRGEDNERRLDLAIYSRNKRKLERLLKILPERIGERLENLKEK